MNRNPDVDAWFAAYDNPQKAAVMRVREIILAADARVTESIKWQAPTFSYRGNIASFFPKAKRHVSLMFHTGAAIPGHHPILEGDGDTSRSAKFASAVASHGRTPITLATHPDPSLKGRAIKRKCPRATARSRRSPVSDELTLARASHVRPSFSSLRRWTSGASPGLTVRESPRPTTAFAHSHAQVRFLRSPAQFDGLDGVEASKPALEAVIRAWCDHRDSVGG